MQRTTKSVLGVLAAAGLLLLAAPVMADPPAHAKAWGYRAHDTDSERSDHRDHNRYRDHDRYDDARYRFDDRDGYRDNDHYDRYGHRYGDRRCNHDRNERDYRETRDYRVVQRLPRGYRTVNYRGDRYYYAGGNWYRPYGQRFVMVRPPAELFARTFPVRAF